MIRARALLASFLLAGLTTSPAPASTAASAASAPAAAPVVRAFVAYGDKAVTVPKNSRGVIRFHGRRGDIVTLGGVNPSRLHLVRRGRIVPQKWKDSGLHRLPTTGTFTFRVGVNRWLGQEVGLVKARVHDLAVDGRALRTPKARRGYIDLVAIRLDRDDRVTVDSGRYEQRVYQRDADYCVGYGGPLLLRPGHDVRVDNDTSAVCDEAATGRTLVRVLSGHRVTAASALQVPVQPDGAPVSVSAPRRAAREIVLTFEGVADDLVYVDEIDGPRLTDGRTMVDRWGRTVSGMLTRSTTGSESFVLSASGATELSTVTDAVGGARTTTVRLRKGIRVADLVTDGPAIDVALDGSGTRLYAVGLGTGSRLESTSQDLGADEEWSVELGSRHPWSCGQEPGGPMGCADNAFVEVSASVPAATSYFFLREPVAVALSAPGSTGTVSLRLVSVTP